MLCMFQYFQSGRMALHWACSGGHTDIVEYLVTQCGVDVDVTDEVASWKYCLINFLDLCNEYLLQKLTILKLRNYI